jgi:hypothetical protein
LSAMRINLGCDPCLNLYSIVEEWLFGGFIAFDPN